MLSAYGLTEETLRIDPANDLLAQHREEVADIVQASGLRSDQALALLERPIGLFVGYVSRLPATRDAHYSAPSGLLRLGLDCALLTARRAQVWEFSGLGHIERRRIEAPRWRIACILAALLCDLHRVATQCTVWGDNERWSPLTEPLARFGERQADRRVRLEWRRGRNSERDWAWNVPLATRIIDDSILDFLNEADPQIVADLFSLLSGERHPSNVIRPLVDASRAKLIMREQTPSSSDSTVSEAPQSQRTSGETREACEAETSGASLDYPTQLFVKEVRRVLARPRACKGRLCLDPDGRLGVDRDWIKTLGFTPTQLQARLASAGWVDGGEGAIRGSMLFLNERAANVLLKDVDRGGLLSATG